MKLLKLLTLWPPFGLEDNSPDPPHFHVLVGPSKRYCELIGPSREYHEIERSH